VMQRTSNTSIIENKIKAMRDKVRDKTGFPLRMLSGGYDASAYAVERINGKQFFASTSGPVWNINRLRFRDVDFIINRTSSGILAGDPVRRLPGLPPFPIGDGGGDGDPNRPYPISIETLTWPNDPDISGPIDTAFPSNPPIIPPSFNIPEVRQGNPAQLYVDPTTVSIKIFTGDAYSDFNLYFRYVGTTTPATISYATIKVEVLVGSSWMRVYRKTFTEEYEEVKNGATFAVTTFTYGIGDNVCEMRVGATQDGVGLTGYLKLTMVSPWGEPYHNSSGDEITTTLAVSVEEGTYTMRDVNGSVLAIYVPSNPALYYNGKRVYYGTNGSYLEYYNYDVGAYTWASNATHNPPYLYPARPRLWPPTENPVGTYFYASGGFYGTLEEN